MCSSPNSKQKRSPLPGSDAHACSGNDSDTSDGFPSCTQCSDGTGLNEDIPLATGYYSHPTRPAAFKQLF